MIRLLLCIFIGLALVSCQKESDLGQNPLPPGSNDSIYLDRIEIVENGDTLTAISFVYDNLNRVVTMAESPTFGDFQVYDYYYHGNDTVPYLKRVVERGLPSIDTLWTYLFYDAAGKITKDSSIRLILDPGSPGPDISTYVRKFSYAPSKIYSVTDVFPGSLSSPYQQTDTSMLDARGNILQTNSWTMRSGVPELHSTSIFTYDDKLHPFTFMSNYRAHRDIPFGETLFLEYLPVNNILTQNETLDGFPWMEIVNTYQYNANGLPSKMLVNDLAIGETWVLLFKYKPA